MITLPEQNYTMIPNTILDLLYHISGNELKILLLLARVYIENEDKQHIELSEEEIMRKTNTTKPECKKCLQRLEDISLIERSCYTYGINWGLG